MIEEDKKNIELVSTFDLEASKNNVTEIAVTESSVVASALTEIEVATMNTAGPD